MAINGHSIKTSKNVKQPACYQLLYIPLTEAEELLGEMRVSFPLANATTAGGFSHIRMAWVNVLGRGLLWVMIQHEQARRHKLAKLRCSSVL